MDAVEMNLDRLKLSLQKRYAELVSSQIDRLMDRAADPNRKVCVNIKSREIRRLGTSGLDNPVKGSGSEKVETVDQAGVESESNDVKTPEITRIRIRQYRKIEHSDGENPASTYSTDQDASDVNKIAHEHITFREKVIGQLSAEKDKSSGLSDSVSAFKAAVPHTSGISTYMEKNLSENFNKHPMSATHPIGSPQFTSERSLTTKDNSSPILARNYARSTTPAFTITVRPVRENNSTKSKNDASPLAGSHPSRTDAGSPTSTRRDGASPINKYDSRSPVLGRSGRATPSNIYSARSPALGRSGETSSPLHRYDAKSPILGRSSGSSPLNRYNARSPTLGRISGASSPLHRYDAKSPILGRSSGSSPLNRYNARSPTLGRISGASSPLHRYDAKSPILGRSSGSSPLNRYNARSPALGRISGATSPLNIYDAKSPVLGLSSESSPLSRYKARSPASDRGSQTSPSPNKCDTKSPALGQSRDSSPLNRYKARSRSFGRNSGASSPLHRYDAKSPVLGRSSEASPLNRHNARRSASDRRSESSPSPNKYVAKSPVLGRNTGANRDDIIRPLTMRYAVERSPPLTRIRAENSTSAMIGSISAERAAIPMSSSRLNSPASARRETESPTLPRSRLNSPASARRETESPTLPSSRLNSPTPTRRGTECPTLQRSRSNSPTSGREDIENPTLQKCHFNSPTSARRGSESPTLPRSRFTSSTPARRGTESHTLTKRSLNSPVPTRRGTESPALPRSRSNSPILARRDTESPTLTKSSLNSPAPIRRGAESPTLPRCRLNSPTPTQRDAESDTLPRSPLNSPTSLRRSTESHTLPESRLNSPTSARRGAESPTLPISHLNSPTSTKRDTESLTLATTRRNSRSPVWKEYLGYDFVNGTNSAALIRPTSTKNHVERRLQKMVDRLEFYNRSVSPKMEKIKESLSPRKPLRDYYIRHAMQYYVEEPNETIESTRSVRRIKQEITPSFDDTSMTDTRENIEHSIFKSLPKQNTNTVPSLAVVKEKCNFEEQHNDFVTDRMVVPGKEYPNTSYNTSGDQIGEKYSRKGKSNQSFDVDNSFIFNQQRKTKPQTEFQTLISPVSDDQPSETRDIARRLVFNSPTQSLADSPVASESGNTRAVCLFRKSADGSENKKAAYLQKESRNDKGRYRTSTKQSNYKTSVQLQNDSRNLGQHRRPAQEIEFNTPAGPIQAQKCPYGRSNFQQYTVSENTVFSSSLQQSSENSTFLYDSLDEIDQRPLAHSTPILEDGTVLFSPISPSNELQPDGIKETRPVIAKSEEYCACCRDKEIKEIELFRNAKKYRSHSNQNEDNYQLDKIKKSERSTRMERSRDYHNKINAIPSSSKDTIKDFALRVYSKRVENGKEPSGKQDYKQTDIAFKSIENGSRFEELVKNQLHQLRDPNDQQNNIIGRKTNETKESESKDITNYDNGNKANVNEEKHVTFAVIRKRIFPVDNECSQANITQEQQHSPKRIEKVNFPIVKDSEAESQEDTHINHQRHRADGQQKHPVTPGTRESKYYKNSAQANHTPKEQDMKKIVKQRILQIGLDTEKDHIENIAPEEKTLKPIQTAGSQRTNIFTSKTKEIKQQYGNGNLANFKSLEIQTRSSTGSQTEILREDIDIHRSEQSSQTEVYIHSERSFKHTQSTNTEEYLIDTNTENIKAEHVQNKSKEDEAEEEDGDNDSDNRKTTDSAKAADDDFQRELLRALSANVHRLYEDIERVISSNALPKDDIPPETIINEAEYMLLNTIETLLSLCNNMDRNDFRKQIEELICRLHGACFEQGARSRDSDYMDEMRTVLDGLTILKENLAVGRERLPGEKSDAFGPSGFIANANKKFKRLLEYYNIKKDGGIRIIRRIGQRTGLERLPAYLQRHLYKVVLVLGILLGIVIVICGPSVARTMSNFIFSRFMYVMCNVSLKHYNPPIV